MTVVLTFRDVPLTLYRGAENRLGWRIYDQDQQSGVAITTGSVVRFKLAEIGSTTALIDCDSVGANADGSVLAITQITAPATGTMLITALELADVPAGVYRGELGYVDHGDGDKWKVIEMGRVDVVDSIAGEVGLT